MDYGEWLDGAHAAGLHHSSLCGKSAAWIVRREDKALSVGLVIVKKEEKGNTEAISAETAKQGHSRSLNN